MKLILSKCRTNNFSEVSRILNENGYIQIGESRTEPKNNLELFFFFESHEKKQIEWLSELLRFFNVGKADYKEHNIIDDTLYQYKPDIFKLVLDNEIGSSNNTEYENIRGCSGSGVYVESKDEEKCSLIGIITKLQSEGRQGIVEGIHIAHIAAFFLEEFDIMLLPRCLNDFSEYLASIINELREVGGQENKLIFLIEKCYRECFSDITPKLIHNRLSDYLFLPSQKNEDYTNKFLWIAWLEILLYKLLQTNIAFEIDDCFKLLTQEKERAGIHVLFTNHLTLDRFIGSLFRSTLYDKLDKQDVLFVTNQRRKFRGGSIAKREQIEGIVVNIDHPAVSDRLTIDNPNEKKLFPIVHVDYIENEIDQILHDTKGLTAVEFSQRFPEELTRLFEEIAN
ncbi:ABC-three component system protein [Enterococcus hirae]|uniref:ABC-three component system protein n=2 Tax=Enterococcus TaxID=1350 RepID=UPI001E31CA52|nr:ABC-three component system protein [Enterococcus hirae]MCR1911349.1 hypothetical protein [Enterococcus hirae]MDL4887122.1 hypothetical protein [Enterococcus hirae]MDL4890162.1 hypothetical protein [Enterococcus hirae]MDL4895865.1 hypothetical protein [Enterococcus hirae]MDL4901656.1 hypothetical protein [Enterococcus hirae]